jgi:ATP/ADP translocase
LKINSRKKDNKYPKQSNFKIIKNFYKLPLSKNHKTKNKKTHESTQQNLGKEQGTHGF